MKSKSKIVPAIVGGSLLLIRSMHQKIEQAVQTIPRARPATAIHNASLITLFKTCPARAPAPGECQFPLSATPPCMPSGHKLQRWPAPAGTGPELLVNRANNRSLDLGMEEDWLTSC